MKPDNSQQKNQICLILLIMKSLEQKDTYPWLVIMEENFSLTYRMIELHIKQAHDEQRRGKLVINFTARSSDILEFKE